MDFQLQVVEGVFLKRYKRFFADVRLGKETVVAHVPNTGSLKTALAPESPCLCTVNDDPKRKLKYTLQMVKPGSSWVGVNTSLSNQLVWEAWQNRLFSHWHGYDGCQKEIKINRESRLDLVLWKCTDEFPSEHRWTEKDFKRCRLHFVEVKNVTLLRDGQAQFPDAVTERGQKHLRELAKLIDKGHSAEIVFTIQRQDATNFGPADDIDPSYGELLRWAHSKGLVITPLVCDLSPKGVRPSGVLPLML